MLYASSLGVLRDGRKPEVENLSLVKSASDSSRGESPVIGPHSSQPFKFQREISGASGIGLELPIRGSSNTCRLEVTLDMIDGNGNKTKRIGACDCPE